MPKLYFYYSTMNAGKSTTLLQSSFNYHERGMRTLLFVPTVTQKTVDGYYLNRFPMGKITCRIGISSPAIMFDNDFNFLHCMRTIYSIENSTKEILDDSDDSNYLSKWVHSNQSNMRKYDCILIDEAQFLTKEQVSQISIMIDEFRVPVLTYGLRTNFKGDPFEGSQYLLAWADELIEIKTICHCGKKANMVLRVQWVEEKDGTIEPTHSPTKGTFVKQKDGNTKLQVRVVEDGQIIEIGGNDRYIGVCRTHFLNKQPVPI